MTNWIIALALALAAAFQASAVAVTPPRTMMATCVHEVRTNGGLVWSATVEGPADKVDAQCAALGAEPLR